MRLAVKALTFEGYESDPVWLYHFNGQTWGTSNAYMLSADVARYILDRVSVPRPEQSGWIERNGWMAIHYETTSDESLRPEYRNLKFASSFASMYLGETFENMQKRLEAEV